jgi:prophage regulatory protein
MSQMQIESKPPAADVQPAVFVRMAAVVRMTGLGRSTIYRLMAEDKFPSPVRLAKRASNHGGCFSDRSASRLRPRSSPRSSGIAATRRARVTCSTFLW